MAYTNTLKIFETLRSVFDEKQATKIAEAVETALKQAMKPYLEKLPQRKILPIQKRKSSNGCSYSGLGNSLSIVGVLTAILFAFFKK